MSGEREGANQTAGVIPGAVNTAEDNATCPWQQASIHTWLWVRCPALYTASISFPGDTVSAQLLILGEKMK